MGKAGILPEEERVELLDGIIYEKMTRYAPHNSTVRRLAGLLRALLGPEWLVSEEKPVVLGRRWRPEPDIAVLLGPEDRYRKADPAVAEIALVVEVADSTYDTDRREKWRGYAGARVSTYWIVDLSRRVVEVYTDPAGRGDSARYRTTATFATGESVPLAVGGREAGRVAVNEILP
jgi:Uma2 family endonuclease